MYYTNLHSFCLYDVINIIKNERELAKKMFPQKHLMVN